MEENTDYLCSCKIFWMGIGAFSHHHHPTQAHRIILGQPKRDVYSILGQSKPDLRKETNYVNHYSIVCSFGIDLKENL